MYHLVPAAAQRRGAIRFTSGAEQHGAENWKKGIADPEWIKQTFCHLIDHLLDFQESGLPQLCAGQLSREQDDNLAAARFGIDVLMHFQEEIKARAASAVKIPPAALPCS